MLSGERNVLWLQLLPMGFQISVVVYYGHWEDTDHNEQWIKLYQSYEVLRNPFQNQYIVVADFTKNKIIK